MTAHRPDIPWHPFRSPASQSLPAQTSCLPTTARPCVTRVKTWGPRCVAIAFLVLFSLAQFAVAELPAPVLRTAFPPGGQAGTAVTVTIEGAGLEGLSALRLSEPTLVAEKTAANQFRVTIPAATPPGIYDLRAVGQFGVSAPRAFVVSRLAEQLEVEPNETLETAATVPLNSAVSGCIEKPGDVDCFRFAARAGQRVVAECWADRMDSQLRGTLELYDAAGQRLAANRGDTGLDPLIDFRVPADGEYVVKLFDLTFAGSPTHFYRLDLDTGPRVEFAVPAVVERGQTSRVVLYGRNLATPPAVAAGPGATGKVDEATAAAGKTDEREAVGGLISPGTSIANADAQAYSTWDRVEVDVLANDTNAPRQVSRALRPAETSVDSLAYYFPGAHMPVLLRTTDVPVVVDVGDNHAPATAQQIPFPCEVSGQLTAGDEHDWFAVQVARGDVLWIEAYGERVGSPVDLDVVVLDATGNRELCHLTDCLDNVGGERFPTLHLDPAGRWVAPAAGRYLLLVCNLIGGAHADPRRQYQLSVRREEPDLHLAAVARRSDQPVGANVWRGGREMLEVMAVRSRGMDSPIRVTAANLPPGFECPPVWIGPGVDRVPLVLTASRDAVPFVGPLTLVGQVDQGGLNLSRPVQGGTLIWPAQALVSARLTRELALATGPEAPVVLTASYEPVGFPGETDFVDGDPLVYQETILDIALAVEHRLPQTPAAIQLTGVGLPPGMTNRFVTVPAGKTSGWLSFHVPSSLQPGPYTFAIQAATDVPADTVTPGAKGTLPVIFVSNPISFRVAPARIELEIESRTPKKIARGGTIQLYYAAHRQHGFIGKVHTELECPGGVQGLLARGVTLVGQSSTGNLQVVATKDAPLGRHPFLRLDAVGTLEDRPTFRAGCFVDLEITE